MKRLVFVLAVIAIAGSLLAQAPMPITPQSVVSKTIFNLVFAATTSSCIKDLGQTVHSVLYSGGGVVGNPTGVQIRLEGSFDSDAATCSTGNWFAISDDGTDPGTAGSNLILGIGAYPFIRLNLVKCTGCDTNNRITASYTGSSAMPGNPFGRYGAGQQVRKVLFIGASIDTDQQFSDPIVTPYGSSAGFLLIKATGFSPDSTFTVNIQDFGAATQLMSYQVANGLTSFVVPVPPSAAGTVQVKYTVTPIGGGNTFSAYYIFYPPGGMQPAGAQPPSLNNVEATQTNATVTITIAPNSFQRAHLFSLNARCSAGTAGVTVKDGTVIMWSSGAAEVGVTSFTKTFPIGYSASPGKSLVVALTTCGAANVGTLDVQGSVF